MALPATGWFVSTNPAQAEAANPVWGRKPVLHYFMFTGELPLRMQRELHLDEAQFAKIKEIAAREADRLAGLNRASSLIVGDPGLRSFEKRQKIAESGYNLQVAETTQDTQAALETALDPETYERLVAWIEARWSEERALHGTPAKPNAARTYSVYATRYDSNGVYTVALPDKCLKLANGGNHLCDDSGYSTGSNYSVRLHYQSSVTVKVQESGPWNVDDNFWAGLEDPQPRRLFPDLPAGMPEAQAAFYNDYNNGEDQFGRTVTAPYGIDLARDVSIDIGLQPGVNDWIDVTFLWTDGWDGQQADVVTLYKPTTLTPAYTGDMCVTAWHRITGYGGDAYLTLNVDTAGQSTNSGEWKPNLPTAGRYEVWAFVPDHPSIQWLCPDKLVQRDTGDARYVITHSGGQKTVSRDQGPLSNMWVNLGSYDFRAGTSGRVTLSDLNGEANLSHTVAFSAVQFRRELPPTPLPTATFTPTPTATPTPTPTPSPLGYTGFGLVEAGGSITVPLGMRFIQPPGLGSAIVKIRFDPAVIDPLSCTADPQAVFGTGSCVLDAVYSDTLHLALSSTVGATGDPLLAYLRFQAVGPPGAYSLLDFRSITLNNPSGMPLSIPFHTGSVCLEPCWNLVFLPVVRR